MLTLSAALSSEQFGLALTAEARNLISIAVFDWMAATSSAAHADD
jgi:hypothetical protein